MTMENIESIDLFLGVLEDEFESSYLICDIPSEYLDYDEF